ncbi:MAG: hypothetical protein ACJ72E_06420 [Marmoricola sp.]
MLNTIYTNVENDYHREQLRRSFRPVLSRRAARALERGDDAAA